MIDSEETRDKILADIRIALKDVAHDIASAPVNNRLVFTSQEEGLAEGFARVFTGIDGQIFRCEDDLQLHTKLNTLMKQRNWEKVVARSRLLEQFNGQTGLTWVNDANGNMDLEQVQVGITDCEYLVARTGSIVMSTALPAGRAFPVYVPVHVVIARESQLVYDLDDAILKMEQRHHANYPSAWYLMSGPSRTGDIEKTLVLGVHGPIEVYVFLIK